MRESSPTQAANKQNNDAQKKSNKEKTVKKNNKGKSAAKKKEKAAKKGKSNKKKATSGKKEKKGKGAKSGKKEKGAKKGKSNKKKGKSTKKKGKSTKKKGKSAKKGKSTKKTGKKEKSLARQSCTFDSYCLVSAAKYLKQLTTKVNSFSLQSARITKYTKMSNTKAGKFNDFSPIQAKVKDAGGNNVSDLRCQNVTNSTGTTVLRNTYSYLANCSKTINDSCSSGMPTVNASVVTVCTTYMNSFASAVNNCTLLNGTAACTCWNSTLLANLSAQIAACDISAASTNLTNYKSKCLSEYGKCRANATASTDVIRTCNQANSVDNTLIAIQTTTANTNALNSLQAAVNASIRVAGKRKRQQALSCDAFVTAVTDIASSAVNAPGLSTIAARAASVASSAPSSCPAQAAQLSATSSSLSKAVTATSSLTSTLQNNLQCK